MKRDMIPLYRGELMANRVGKIIRGDLEFDIIRPGYDSQGRRRASWTQFCIFGVPVYECKKHLTMGAAIKEFDRLWTLYIGDDLDLAQRAINAARVERKRRFRDGVTGESPAPALRVDGRPEGERYEA